MMKRNTIVAVLFSSILVTVAIASTNTPKGDSERAERKQDTTTQVPATPKLAEKIEVVHFHGTQQCWSCKTVGEFALKTITEKFPEEYKQGIIVFRDINAELPENEEIVKQYQARSSALFVNAISERESSISEDTTVWRLVANESQFSSYFENKLRTLLQ